jgi:hypothetical protein
LCTLSQGSVPVISIISCFSSDFSFEIHVSVSNLIPEDRYELWIFYQDGRIFQWHRGLTSNKHGKLVDQQGNEDIVLGHGSSSPIERGTYILGINRNEFKYNQKPNFSDWIGSNNNKSHIRFQVPCQNKLVIHLNEIVAVPWGSIHVVTGFVSTEGHNPAGTIVYSGKKITLRGTGVTSLDTTLNDAGKFSCVLKIQDDVTKHNQLQAFFEGDEHYTRSSSNTVSYETLRHDTILTIDLDPLRLNVPIAENELKQEVSLKPNEYFRIRGLLLDSSLNIPLSSKRIYFVKDFGAMVYATTERDGTYHIENLKTPELFGQHKITAIYEGDDKYMHSKSSEIIVSIQESVKNQDIKIADSLVKIPLSLQQLPGREISILQAFRLFHA